MKDWNGICRNVEVMGGRACICGTRVTVSMIVGQLGSGHTIEELVRNYPYLNRDDILQAVQYAAEIA